MHKMIKWTNILQYKLSLFVNVAPNASQIPIFSVLIAYQFLVIQNNLSLFNPLDSNELEGAGTEPRAVAHFLQ